ncbi:MAG: M10 family metallopeptidase C-terminal domain-containing protein [Caulobacteraceae bacterium]
MTTAGHDGKWSVTVKLNGGSVHQFTETAVDLAGNVGSSAGVAYWANAGNRTLVGGAGNDVLIGQKGDILTGGAGHDHFVVGAGFGKTTVTDFASGSDQIGISHSLANNAASVMAHARASHGDTVISFGNGDSLTLQGVLPSALHAGDFFFT